MVGGVTELVKTLSRSITRIAKKEKYAGVGVGNPAYGETSDRNHWRTSSALLVKTIRIPFTE